jgi:hypothetical protein
VIESYETTYYKNAAEKRQALHDISNGKDYAAFLVQNL